MKQVLPSLALLLATASSAHPLQQTCAGCQAIEPPALVNDLVDPLTNPVTIDFDWTYDVTEIEGSCPLSCMGETQGCPTTWSITVHVDGARTAQKRVRVDTLLSGAAQRLNDGEPNIQESVDSNDWSSNGTSGEATLPCGEATSIQITVSEIDAQGNVVEAWKSMGISISCSTCAPVE
jgi:hypothetical protein